MPWFDCRVTRTSTNNNARVLIGLSDSASPPAFNERWFSVSDSARREMLASGLTAMSTGLLVSAELASSAEYSNILQLQVVAR
jgi:hypothetical protein